MKLLVIGSINVDLTIFVDGFPDVGETISSNEYKQFHGGKGANQAIAALRMKHNSNDEVYLFGKIGKDNIGQNELNYLKSTDLKTEFISRSATKTGLAIITVSKKDSDNTIVISKGANNKFNEKDLPNLTRAIKKTDAILIQLESNDWLIENSIKLANKFRKVIYFNPAPAKNFKIEWMKHIHYFFPNKTELELISNIKCDSREDIFKACKIIQKQGVKNIIVTLGSKGAIKIDNKNKIKEYTAYKAKEVQDTTGAGDTFIGTFIMNKDDMGEDKAIDLAMKAASICVRKKGAQSSIPTYKEVKDAEKKIFK